MSDDLTAAFEPHPDDVASWLAGNDWERIAYHDGRPALWSRGGREILQPTLREASDYDLRFAEMLNRLSAWTERSTDALVDEMVHEGADVTEWRANGLRSRDFSVPLEDGLSLVQSVRNAFVAAASATVQRRGYFGLSTLKMARQHAQVVRMGQTRRGSYVVPIISRVPGAVKQPTDGQGVFDIDVSAQPFERRVMAVLAESLRAVQSLAVHADREPTQKELNESIGSGVSYELCAALADVLGTSSFSDLDVNFAWARRASRHPDVSTVELPREAAPVIGRMAEKLRGSEQIGEQVVTGSVWQIKREPGEAQGDVKLRAQIGTQVRTLTMTLTREQMHEAAVALDEAKRVYVRGRLVRGEGRAWRFESISEFGVLEAAPIAWGTGGEEPSASDS